MRIRARWRIRIRRIRWIRWLIHGRRCVGVSWIQLCCSARWISGSRSIRGKKRRHKVRDVILRLVVAGSVRDRRLRRWRRYRRARGRFSRGGGCWYSW